MGKLAVTQFVSIDSVIQDPCGRTWRRRLLSADQPANAGREAA